MTKRKAEIQISEGDAVLGFFQSWPYAATVEKIFAAVKLEPETGERRNANYYLVRWKGFSGKKALGILRSGDIVPADESNVKKRQALEAARRDAAKEGAEGRLKFEKVFSEICGFTAQRPAAPAEVWDKEEWKFLWDIFRLPEKLRLHLIAQEERIMREERKRLEGVPKVSEILEKFIVSGGLAEDAAPKKKKTKSSPPEVCETSPEVEINSRRNFADFILRLFEANALTRLLYNFEVPDVLMNRKGKMADTLCADHLLRLLAIFPEIVAAWGRASSLSQPSASTAETFAQLIEHSHRFADLADFLSRNFRAFFTVDDDEDPETGPYYLQWDKGFEEEKEVAIIKIPAVSIPMGKRKRRNEAVRRIN